MSGFELVNEAVRDFDAVKKLVESGAPVNDPEGNSMPAIVTAACYGRFDIIQYLLENGANPNLSKDRLSALKTAADHNDYRIVKLLIDNGADPNFENNGEVALTLACNDKGDTEEELNILKLLLPITDKKYHQKAYEYCVNENMRKFIKENTTVEEPENGFGSSKYKQKLHYESPPKHPLIREIWEAYGECIDKINDPNRAMGLILERMDFRDYQFEEDGTENDIYIYKSTCYYLRMLDLSKYPNVKKIVERCEK